MALWILCLAFRINLFVWFCVFLARAVFFWLCFLVGFWRANILLLERSLCVMLRWLEIRCFRAGCSLARECLPSPVYARACGYEGAERWMVWV